MISQELEVRLTPTKGRGVFARRAFAPGEVVESALTIELSPKDASGLVGFTLDDYYFAHPQDPDAGLMVLGLAILCNHSPTANVDTLTERDPELGWIVTLRAARPIAVGEEITRRYACALWFEEAS